MIPAAELEAMRARCDEASPGPWRAVVEGRDQDSGDSFIMVGEGVNRSDDMYVTRESVPASAADLEFIANARQDVPRLLDEIARLTAK